MKKLILFDIDGTLIHGRGVPKKVAIEVIQRFFPHFKNGHEVPFSGMTDPLIVKQVLQANGQKIAMDDPLINEILDAFIKELSEHVTPEDPPQILPGVKELLNQLQQNENMCLGLVTGNVAAGAKIKLSAAGLYPYFSIGAFGSDHWDRNILPAIAVRRAHLYYAVNFSKNDTWIIGDSLRDVECAQANGLKCLAVETGKTDASLLKKAGADIVLPDLLDLSYIHKLFKN